MMHNIFLERGRKKQGRGSDLATFLIIISSLFSIFNHLITKQEWNIPT